MKMKMIAIYINDSEQPFTDMIACKWKTEETRNRKTLDKYCGFPVIIIRTGKGKNKLICSATLEYARAYTTEKEFRAAFHRHRVKIGGGYDIKAGKCKHAYQINDVKNFNGDVEYRVLERYGRVACLIEFEANDY